MNVDMRCHLRCLMECSFNNIIKKKLTKIIIIIIKIQQKICYLIACCANNKTELITDMII